MTAVEPHVYRWLGKRVYPAQAFMFLSAQYLNMTYDSDLPGLPVSGDHTTTHKK
ncbi:hypothetical protein ACLQ8T_05615 [Glutamicibacter sp. FR1]|uniref:hypothetical protein n=1 Tax=Glutamicibacter sp. FR1 TaxID=3393744 RepID=UPI0039B07DE7